MKSGLCSTISHSCALQVSNSSNITIQRQPDPAPRPSGQGSRPPPVTSDAFPSLGRPTAATSASWVPKKTEPASKPAPKPAVQTAPQPPTAGDFPDLGPVAAHGNFGSFSAPRSAGRSGGGSAWSGSDQTTGKSKGKKKTTRRAENGADTPDAVTAGVNGLSLSGTGASRAADGSFQYRQPENFTARNGRLVQQARELFPSELEFSAFKTLSSE